MAYFSLPPGEVIIRKYPFDYHSHFSGILPTQGPGEYSLSRVLTHGVDRPIGQYFRLFERALDFMIEPKNPFDQLLGKANKAQYERGECCAESIYFASLLLARQLNLYDYIHAPINEKNLYVAVKDRLRDGAEDEWKRRSYLYDFVRYFNSKIYSSNKFTPFDDAYKTRSFLVDGMSAEIKSGWVKSTLAYLKAEGIRYTQTPLGAADVGAIEGDVATFNGEEGTEYRLLIHTPAAYTEDGSFQENLQKILASFSEKRPCVVGIDLLGVENRVGDYKTLFDVLRKNKDAMEQKFGKGKIAPKMMIHIHCGEGAGSSPDNRSMIGYYVANARRLPDAAFYRALSDYVAKCHEATTSKRVGERRGPSGAPGRKANGIAGLFDELFRNNSFTYDGTLLRRFDITSDTTRSLVAYNAKRNIMALCEDFAEKSSNNDDGGRTWYQVLSGEGSPYAFRLGHDYYYRNYVASKYPALTFDTNLGSNAITGASALFASLEGYRINRGFRHLEGYIDTDVLEATGRSVAFLESAALTERQIDTFLEIASTKIDGNDEQIILATLLKREDYEKTLKTYLLRELAPLGVGAGDVQSYYRLYSAICLALAGESQPSATLSYQVLTKAFALFQNWRAYLLGADGQGVEHTDIGGEFLRMVILLAYELLPVGSTSLSTELIESIQALILNVAAKYWETTMGTLTVTGDAAYRLVQLDGFKAPASVVTVRRKEIERAV